MYIYIYHFSNTMYIYIYIHIILPVQCFTSQFHQSKNRPSPHSAQNVRLAAAARPARRYRAPVKRRRDLGWFHLHREVNLPKCMDGYGWLMTLIGQIWEVVPKKIYGWLISWKYTFWSYDSMDDDWGSYKKESTQWGFVYVIET